MILTEKETMLLKDTQTQEQLCVQKYTKAAAKAKDPQLKALFEEISEDEQEHVKTVTKILNGVIPVVPSSTDKTKSKESFTAYYDDNADATAKQEDMYLCNDCIDIEKYVAGVYNNNIFSCQDRQVCENLNHIQKEEQQHGASILNYMSVNGMI